MQLALLWALCRSPPWYLSDLTLSQPLGVTWVLLQDGALTRLRSPQSGERLFFQQVIPAMCAGNIMGPAGETIKGIGFRTGVFCSPRDPMSSTSDVWSGGGCWCVGT